MSVSAVQLALRKWQLLLLQLMSIVTGSSFVVAERALAKISVLASPFAGWRDLGKVTSWIL